MANEDISLDNIMLVLSTLTKEVKESEKRYFEIVQENEKRRGKREEENEKRRRERQEEWKEIKAMFRETDRRFKETDKKINKAQGMFTSKWGELVESIVRPACLKLFRERGVDVFDISRNRKIERGGIKRAEYDIVLANGSEVVIVEVKTTLTTSAVSYFVEKLKEVKTWLPDYANKKVYGAVAGISLDNDAVELAEKKGLFIIENSGEGLLSISNPIDFKPKAY